MFDRFSSARGDSYAGYAAETVTGGVALPVTVSPAGVTVTMCSIGYAAETVT